MKKLLVMLVVVALPLGTLAVLVESPKGKEFRLSLVKAVRSVLRLAPDKPVLTMQWSNAPAPLTSLYSSSVPILVTSNGIFVPAIGANIQQSVACGWCKCVTMTDKVGTTNELLTSSNLTQWTALNVRWVMYGTNSPIVFFVPRSNPVCFFRARRCSWP